MLTQSGGTVHVVGRHRFVGILHKAESLKGEAGLLGVSVNTHDGLYVMVAPVTRHCQLGQTRIHRQMWLPSDL